MATKRKKKTPTKRRRMGAASGGGSFITGALSTAAGAVLGTYVINGPMETTSYVNIGAIVVGAVIPRFMPKSGIVEGIGNGLIAAGMVSIFQNANVINGMKQRTVLGRLSHRRMGAAPIASVAGPNMSKTQRNAALITANAGRTVLNGVPPAPRRRPLANVSGFCDGTA